MDRKTWLLKFIELADSNAKTLEYRRHCRIIAQHLPRHIAKLPEYRAELEKLLEAERLEVEAKLNALAEHEAEHAKVHVVEVDASSVLTDEERAGLELLMSSNIDYDDYFKTHMPIEDFGTDEGERGDVAPSG